MGEEKGQKGIGETHQPSKASYHSHLPGNREEKVISSKLGEGYEAASLRWGWDGGTRSPGVRGEKSLLEKRKRVGRLGRRDWENGKQVPQHGAVVDILLSGDTFRIKY